MDGFASAKGTGAGLLLALAAISSAAAGAQSFRDTFQVNGFATQSFIYSSGNNYLGMDTTSGSPDWTEAAVNVNDQVLSRLRMGAQVHVAKLGDFGSYVPTIDWALADFSATEWFGVRAGKVKIRWGLLNDTQDYDPGYLWSLLPESVYGVDIRATNLSQYGAEAYGRVPLGEGGSLEYSGYYGYYYYAANDGYDASFAQQGIFFTHPGFGKTPGFDLRWNTPLKGLKAGASLMMYNAKGDLTGGGRFVQPLAFWPTVYAEYNRGRIYASGQYVKLVQYQTVTLPGFDSATTGQDTRAWFAMGAYRLTGKLQAGAYYTHYLVANARDDSDPANYFNDTVLSARYDIGAHVYAKVEGHLVRGNAVGFYAEDNASNLQPASNVLVAKIGYSF